MTTVKDKDTVSSPTDLDTDIKEMNLSTGHGCLGIGQALIIGIHVGRIETVKVFTIWRRKIIRGKLRR